MGNKNGIRGLWSEEQDKILIDNYANKPMEELVNLLDGCFDPKQIRHRANGMGMVRDKLIISMMRRDKNSEAYMIGDVWNDKDDEIMIREYPNRDNNEIIDILGRRFSISMIKYRAKLLGLKKTKETYSAIMSKYRLTWTDDEPLR